MAIYQKSRKEVCRDLNISYTTFSDWVNGKTYPRMDAQDSHGEYTVEDYYETPEGYPVELINGIFYDSSYRIGY